MYKRQGVRVPLLENIDFEIRPYSMFNAPKWYADGIHLLEELAHTAIAVSYTHLDVYKRQVSIYRGRMKFAWL